jgi:geranylgeranyl pyrophosphate synthase
VIERPHAGGAALEHFLAALDTRMRAEIARTPAALPARMLLDAGGKRLRAQLLWWSANATAPAALDPENERLVRAATAIEFAHLGSLIHDDIVDGGETRRGIATLHHQYGVRIATDAGTALAHLANQLVTSLGRPARQAVRRAILATCHAVCPAHAAGPPRHHAGKDRRLLRAGSDTRRAGRRGPPGAP